MNWPQYTWLALQLSALIYNAYEKGRDGHSFRQFLVPLSLYIAIDALLYAGGFFGGGAG